MAIFSALVSTHFVRRLVISLVAATMMLPAMSIAETQSSPPVQTSLPADAQTADYESQEVMIPMRDGVRLHTLILRPKNSTEKLPFLINRSPYGYDAKRLQRGLAPGGSNEYLGADKYIFIYQDLRGRFGSEGEFITSRPNKTTPDGIDESTDTYDTIDWLVKNLPNNNGKAGAYGVSYDGWTAAVATIDPHPALKAVSSQASPEDQFIGDDFLHNGALRLDYAWSWVSAAETDGRTWKSFNFGGETDGYSWYLKQKDLATLDQQHLGRTMPSWQNFVAHPNYDSLWKKSRTSHMMHAKVGTPNLIVGGWWDQEDFYGPLTIYENQEKGDDKGLNYLVVGPWNHSGWRGKGSAYGPYALGTETGTWFRKEVELPWFRYWLKGLGQLNQPEALIFQTGSNQWQRLKSWPPTEGVTTRNLYLRANGKLSFEAPTAAEASADRFRSDPADPVPYRDRTILKPILAPGSKWSTWLADDQAPFTKRKDVLFWQTELLTEDLTISGDIAAKLFASTTGSDADWVVKLIDVHPSDESMPAELRGRQRIIANDVFRGRFRQSFETPRAITPNAILDYKIDLHSASHVFKKGHRIAVQIQSSWFPLIDRNPQTFVPNILKAKPEDFKAQTHSIYHTPSRPSAISVTFAEPER